MRIGGGELYWAMVPLATNISFGHKKKWKTMVWPLFSAVVARVNLVPLYEILNTPLTTCYLLKICLSNLIIIIH